MGPTWHIEAMSVVIDPRMLTTAPGPMGDRPKAVQILERRLLAG